MSCPSMEAATNEAVPPMLAPDEPDPGRALVAERRDGALDVCQIAEIIFSPCEHPASPPGQ